MELNRSSHPLTRQEFVAIAELYLKRPWLIDKANAVGDLFELCKDNKEQALICSLLHRFTFVSGSDLVQRLESIRQCITETWKLDPENTKLVAANDGTASDSSEAILWMLKPRFADSDGWVGKNFISKLTVAAKQLVEENDNIVIVDEFVGTGKQIHRQITWLKDQLALRGCKPESIYLCTVARHANVQYDIDALVKEFYSTLTISRGISDFYEAGQIPTEIANMLRLEGELSKTKGKSILPSLGFGKCEALYSCEIGNTPNNVFPIFWWKWMNNGFKRATLVNRVGG